MPARYDDMTGVEHFVPAFLLALLAQPGNRQALLTAILADRFGRPLRVALAAGGMPWLVAAGSTLGAFAVALVAVQFGEAEWTGLPLRRMRQAAAAIFLVAGIVIGLGALRLTH